MVAVISIDASPFLVFSDLTCDHKDKGIGVSGCTVLSGSKKTKLGSSDYETLPSESINTGVVLVPCWRMEMRPYSYFW